MMVDPRHEAVLARAAKSGVWEDKTADIESYRHENGKVSVTFSRSGKTYTYRLDSIQVLRDPHAVSLGEGFWVEARGEHLVNASLACYFESLEGTLVRIFWEENGSEKHGMYAAHEVRFLNNPVQNTQVEQVLSYWTRIVAAKAAKAAQKAEAEGKEPPHDFLGKEFDQLGEIHPESVLARYCAQQAAEKDELPIVPLAPFQSNLSQRQAVQNALSFPVSVIEGPPGTGKTQTILNLIATVVAGTGASVGVVSSNNSAVDNVREKLEELGFGFILASLGNKDRRQKFFAPETQSARNAALDLALSEPLAEVVDSAELEALAGRLDSLQADERTLAAVRQELDAYLLEQEHFLRFLQGQEVHDLEGRVLLSRSSERLLDYLADAALDKLTDRPFGWIRRLKNRIKYGSLRGMDPHDTDVLLRVQQAYYEQKIAELRSRVASIAERLQREDLKGLLAEHARLSLLVFRQGLQSRYARTPRTEYDVRGYQRELGMFLQDYPVLLSTTHSLRASLGRGGGLLDLLIIDEASQVDLLTAALALASCRRVVIVGDRKQLPHIAEDLKGTEAENAEPPAPGYDYREQSVLSSFHCLYGDALPSTLLREHYRCHPTVIGFCNEKFYGGELITLTTSDEYGANLPAMSHMRTSEGNHMRQFTTGGRNNQREADEIAEKLRASFCPDLSNDEVGVVSQYRKQVETVAATLAASEEGDGVEVDTVHRFQGREKRAVIMTTVLDDSWRGRWEKAVAFVDDPRLINVAVSRAKERFILVTSHGMLPTSRNLRDLMGYIRYSDPNSEVTASPIVSVFDLLYKNYSRRLDGLASRLRGELRYPSEDIIWTVLGDTLEQEFYKGLEVVPQVLLRNLVPTDLPLDEMQKRFIKHRSSLDFVIYNRITKEPLLAIEVNGFAFHANNPQQLARDAIKASILKEMGLPLLPLDTNGSDEVAKITAALDRALIS